MPAGTWPVPKPSQAARNLRAKLLHPPPNRLVANVNTAFRHEVLDIAIAQREPEIQPNSMLNGNGRELVALVGHAMHQQVLSAMSPVGVVRVTVPFHGMTEGPVDG